MNFAYILPTLRQKRITDITLADLNALQGSLSHKPSQANHSVLVMSKILNLSEQWGLRTMGSNPCRHIQLFKDKKRNRFLDKIELKGLWDTLDEAYTEGMAEAGYLGFAGVPHEEMRGAIESLIAELADSLSSDIPPLMIKSCKRVRKK